jgi:hypothetical protein
MDLGKKKRRMPTIWCGSLPVSSPPLPLLFRYFLSSLSPSLSLS